MLFRIKRHNSPLTEDMPSGGGEGIRTFEPALRTQSSCTIDIFSQNYITTDNDAQGITEGNGFGNRTDSQKGRSPPIRV
jgi:hypothetical protein